MHTLVGKLHNYYSKYHQLLLMIFNTFSIDVAVEGEFDNPTTDHTAVVDPDQLIGPQVIDMIMSKPGMIRYSS